MTIPDMKQSGHRSLIGAAAGRAPLQLNAAAGAGNLMEVATGDREHPMRRFYEGLRNRLIVHFEIWNLKHKPKLVAVTSCGRGAGVSSTAAGLAASLSETGDGSVLLVDMNCERGAAQHFIKGKAVSGLETALTSPVKSSDLIHTNLYAMDDNPGRDLLPEALPRRFATLMPKFKASNYDFIIFDMPPVSQTSVTARIAGFMDMVLLVIESEKTNQDVVKRANALLAESNAKVRAVLNKTRNYVPARLQQELLDDH
jgi:Mrp family chromosome partitioning ATPase